MSVTMATPESDLSTDVAALNERMEGLDAAGRIRLLAETFGDRVVATSSFGLQAAVMLQLLKDNAPEIPIVFIDTGYLFPETYRYSALLEEQIGFESKVYHPEISAARQEALHGKLWEQGAEGMERYGLVNKVEPMNRALRDLGADVWISGLRRAQSSTRSRRTFAERQSRTLKVYPILDWQDSQVEEFLDERQLPRHPLAAAGYVTMGDWHSTKPGSAGSRESTRFNGEKYECGLHLDSGEQDFQI